MQEISIGEFNEKLKNLKDGEILSVDLREDGREATVSSYEDIEEMYGGVLTEEEPEGYNIDLDNFISLIDEDDIYYNGSRMQSSGADVIS